MQPDAIDLIISGGTIVTSQGRQQRDIGIAEGRIVALSKPGSLQHAQARIDASGLLILPGIVDTHFHCRSPDHPEREDFDSGSAAAAASGVTTLLEMPISNPACSTPQVLADRMALVGAQARIDIGLYAAVGDLDAPVAQEMADAGAIAFKLMMHTFPPGREASFRGLAMTDNRDIYRALEIVAATGRLLAVHCEDQNLIDLFEEREMTHNQHGPLAHARSRPTMAEAVAVARLGAMNEQAGARVHVVHVSSARAAAYIAWFQARGQRMTGETTPAYLFSTLKDAEEHGPYVKVNPPLREESERLGLWDALQTGTLTTIASDHAPFRGAEKEAGWENIWGVGSGIPGVELTAPLLFDHALRGEVSLEQVVGWVSERPAELFGIDGQKGFLRIGNDADLILLDPARETELTAERFVSRSADAIRHPLGRRCRGEIVSVWSRGRCVAAAGKVLAAPGDGRVLLPDALSDTRTHHHDPDLYPDSLLKPSKGQRSSA